AAPLYLSETAPPKWRGSFSTGFQFFLGIGVVAAGCINFATSKHTWGWRVSLGLAVVPALVMTIGSFLITDTPNSLVERGKIEQARKALHKIRGSSIDIEPELEELIKFTQVAKSVKQEPFKTILKREYRPHLVMAFAIPFFQQLTGINIVAFYSPNLFQSIGLGHDGALISSIILGSVSLTSNLISAGIVDRFGRRILFITGGAVMLVNLIAVAIVLAVVSGVDGSKDISKGNAILVLVLLCLYTAGFVMTLFIIFFLPETKGIPLESMYTIWGSRKLMEESCLACGKSNQECDYAIRVTQGVQGMKLYSVISMTDELPEKANMEVAP
ncbi:sugar transport protein 5-like, partial [Trifolium pratense]